MYKRGPCISLIPCFSYEEVLVKVSPATLSGKLFKNILQEKNSMLRSLLPPRKYQMLQPQEATQVHSGFQDLEA